MKKVDHCPTAFMGKMEDSHRICALSLSTTISSYASCFDGASYVWHRPGISKRLLMVKLLSDLLNPTNSILFSWTSTWRVSKRCVFSCLLLVVAQCTTFCRNRTGSPYSLVLFLETQQLLGSETVRILRANGVQSTICGVSANDAREIFFQAGADAFMFKPFPVEPAALYEELYKILLSGQARRTPAAMQINEK